MTQPHLLITQAMIALRTPKLQPKDVAFVGCRLINPVTFTVSVTESVRDDELRTVRLYFKTNRHAALSNLLTEFEDSLNDTFSPHASIDLKAFDAWFHPIDEINIAFEIAITNDVSVVISYDADEGARVTISSCGWESKGEITYELFVKYFSSF